MENKVCQRCGAAFRGCKTARYCLPCRKRASSESCKRRGLCHIGAKARWGEHKPIKEGVV